jgi:hypothetical protein
MFYIMNNHYSGVVGKGAPVDFHIATSGTPALNFGIGTTQGAAHPSAANGSEKTSGFVMLIYAGSLLVVCII